MQQENTQEQKSPKTCSCGRSPLGICIGWHSLGEDEFRQALAVYESNIIAKDNIVE